MGHHRTGGDAGQAGGLPSEFEERRATQPDAAAPAPEEPAADQSSAVSGRRLFTVQFGSFTAATQRIGGVLGSRGARSARGLPATQERSWPAAADLNAGSHGLQVIHIVEHEEEPRLHHSHEPPSEDEIAARMMQEIEEAVAELRRHTTARVISLRRAVPTASEVPMQDRERASEAQHPSETSDQKQFAPSGPWGLLSKLFSRISQRAHPLAAKPMHTVGALLAFVLAFGASLLRRSQR